MLNPIESLFGIIYYVNAADLTNLLSTCKELWSHRKEFLCRWFHKNMTYQPDLPTYLKDIFFENYGTKMIYGPEFTHVETPGPLPAFKYTILEGLGPKLIVSEKSTADHDIIIFKFNITSNIALDFGAIPDGTTAMHHRGKTDIIALTTKGTSGSLFEQERITKEACITIMLTKGVVKFFIKNKPQKVERICKNNNVYYVNYTGPSEAIIRLNTNPNINYRIGLTVWKEAILY